MTRNANGSHISGVTRAQAIHDAYQRGQPVYITRTRIQVEVLSAPSPRWVRIRTDHGTLGVSDIRDVHVDFLRVGSPLEALAKIVED